MQTRFASVIDTLGIMQMTVINNLGEFQLITLLGVARTKRLVTQRVRRA